MAEDQQIPKDNSKIAYFDMLKQIKCKFIHSNFRNALFAVYSEMGLSEEECSMKDIIFELLSHDKQIHVSLFNFYVIFNSSFISIFQQMKEIADMLSTLRNGQPLEEYMRLM